jgi:hypothetical protein
MPQPLSADTDPAAEAVQLRLLRAATVARRTELAFSLTRTVVELARRSLRRLDPAASEEEIHLRFVAHNYGADLARGLGERLSRKPRT